MSHKNNNGESDTKSDEKILALRNKIDMIDDRIGSLLRQRFLYVCRIGEIKKMKGAVIRDVQREQEIIARVSAHAQMDYAFIAKIFTQIFQRSRKEQRMMRKIGK